jgi:hypothetical protein
MICAATVFALLLFARWYWKKSTYDRFILRAGQINLGQTESEVQAVMSGESCTMVIGSLDNVTPRSGHRVKSKIFYFSPAKSQIELFLIRSATRILKRSPTEDLRLRPVEVRLDDEGLVYWIRRGTEIEDDGPSATQKSPSGQTPD